MNDSKFNYIRSLGFSGALNDITAAFYRYVGAIGNSIQDLETNMFDTMGIERAALQDRWNSFLSRVGYSGDNEKAWGDGITDGSLLREQAIGVIRRNNGSAWWVPDSLTSSGIYTDSTGTTPVSAVGDVIGLLTDRSYGAGNFGAEITGGLTAPGNWMSAGGASISAGVLSLPSAGSQTTNTNPSVANKTYKVTFTVSGATAGLWLNVYVGTTQASGVVQGASNGQKVVHIRATNTAGVVFQNDAGSTGTCAISAVEVREVLGNHATQATTANKPVIARVPRKLGPNLFPQPTLDSSSGLTLGAGWSVTGGAAVGTATSDTLTDIGNAAAYITGRTYVVAFDVSSYTLGNLHVYLKGTPAFNVASSVGRKTLTLVAGSSNEGIAFLGTGSAFTGSLDNISVREVLEWSNAQKFDGSNDALGIPKLINIGQDHTVICSGKSPSSLAAYPFLFSPAVGPSASVAEMYADAGKYVAFRWKNDAGVYTYAPMGLSKVLNENQPFVASVVSKAGGLTTPYHDGVSGPQISSPTGTSNLSTAGQLGGGTTGTGFDATGYGSFFCVIPAAISDADRKIIERFAAYLAGVTYLG